MTTKVLDDVQHLRSLTAEGRVLLAFTPDGPPAGWTCWAWTDRPGRLDLLGLD